MKILVTLGGECFEVEYADVGHADGRDGVLYNFKLRDLVKDRGLRNGSLFRSGTDKVFIENYDARIENVRSNVLRRAFDSGTFSFNTPVVSDRFHELRLIAADFQPQKKATDETIRRFIKFGAFYLGFKHSPNAQNLFVDFDCTEDLDYLGAKSEDLGRNVRLLTEEGYLRSSAATFANPLRVLPTAKLIREIESNGDAKSSPLKGGTLPLSEVERDICKFVVRQFLGANEATSKRDLLREFRGSLSGPLRKLVDQYVLKTMNPIQSQETYLPRTIAFHYSGDADALTFARQATETVLKVVHSLFEQELEEDGEHQDQRQFTLADAERESRRFAPDVNAEVDSKMIRVGLYLAEEFGVFHTLQHDDSQQMWIVSFRPSERIYEVAENNNAWDEHIRRSSVSVERVWEKTQSESSLTAVPSNKGIFDIPRSIFGLQTEADQRVSRKIFLVHGHAEDVKQTVAKFLKTLNLEVVILHEQPNRGRTIVEKFEKHSDVGFAVVLLTPDDMGAPLSDPSKTKKRARQNVILELGYFIGKLGRGRVCPIYVEEVELPSDLHGVLWVAYDQSGEWRAKLAKEIQAAGIEVRTRD